MQRLTLTESRMIISAIIISMNLIKSVVDLLS
jgi:hypothetical protein